MFLFSSSIILPKKALFHLSKLVSNLVRDLIELANRNNETAASIFRDQEKAFDGVNDEFLLKVAQFLYFVMLNYSVNIQCIQQCAKKLKSE